jgi:endonuclease YncB( thermonuclease family)
MNVDDVRTILIIMGLLLLSTIANAERLDRKDLFVKDGDTIIVGPPYDKHDKDQEYRLVGFDSPETARGKCPAEIEKGNQASARLIALLDSARQIDLTEIQCSCDPNAASCNFGRRCGALTVDNEDVGAILIREELAVPFICSATRCPRQKSWCNPPN